MYTKQELDFAYKYPFSEQAKGVIKSLDMKGIDQIYLITGKAQIDEALQTGKIEYKESNYGKLEFVVGYVYSRMLVSALKAPGTITRYARAEARRSRDALENDSDSNLLMLAKELGLEARVDGDIFQINLADFLANSPFDQEFSLANQKLSGGTVNLDKHKMIKVLEVAISNAIARGLPIKVGSIPKQVVEYAKGISIPVPKIQIAKGAGNFGWIEKLMQTPIADCRHRTVNLILAPYLINVKGMEVEKAAEAISNYITLCKTVNPDTKVTDKYIKYQCDYAKSHGIRPMSLTRARVELGGIDFQTLLGEEETVKQ